MSKLYSADVLTAIYQKIYAGINTMLTTIRSERSDATLPDILSVTTGYPTSQLPEIIITYENSDPVDDENLSDDISIIPEVYNLQIMLTTQSIESTIQMHMCYYEEALKRLLHGCQISGVTWVRVKSSIIDDITSQNEIYKFVGLKIEVRVD